jgi:FHA domain
MSGVAPPPAPAPVPAAPAAPAPTFVSRAILSGTQGIFTVLPSMEMKAGRDGALCQILLSEPRVSGTHATLKIDNGQLFVRDDNSNNGTMINGQRIPPGAWTPVGQGAQLRFGPVEFSVNLE